MRYTTLILLAFIAFGCQNQTRKTGNSASEKTGTAKFVFQEELHNFGTLQAGEVVAYSFGFTNAGDGNLVIRKYESDCGCMTVEYPKEPVKPGESGYIEVIFNSAGEVGKVYKEVVLFSNAEPTEVKLAITANVQNELINLYSKN